MTFKATKFIAGFVLLSLVFFTKVYAEDPVGFITEIKGQAKKIDDKKKEIELSIYDQILIDELIKVENLASVTFLLKDNSILTLKNGASGKISDFDDQGSRPKLILFIEEGEFIFESGSISKLPNAEVKIKLPNSEIDLSGTRVGGSISAENNSEKIYLAEDSFGNVGEIIISTSAGEVQKITEPNKGVNVAQGQQMSEAELNEDEIQSISEGFQESVLKSTVLDEKAIEKELTKRLTLGNLGTLEGGEGDVSLESVNSYKENIMGIFQERFTFIADASDGGNVDFLSNVMSESDIEASQYMMETMMSGHPEFVGDIVENLIDSNTYDFFSEENLEMQEKMFETVAQYSTEDNHGALAAMMEQGDEAYHQMAMEILIAGPGRGPDPDFPNDPNFLPPPDMNLALFVMSDLAENNAEILISMAAYDQEQFNDFTNHVMEMSSVEDSYELTNVMSNVDDQMREMMFEEMTMQQNSGSNYLVAAVFENMTEMNANMMQGMNEEIQSAMFAQVVMATQDMMEETAYMDEMAYMEEMSAMQEMATMQEMAYMDEMANVEMAYMDEMAAMEQPEFTMQPPPEDMSPKEQRKYDKQVKKFEREQRKFEKQQDKLQRQMDKEMRKMEKGMGGHMAEMMSDFMINADAETSAMMFEGMAENNQGDLAVNVLSEMSQSGYMEEMAEQNEEAFSDFTQNAFETASAESSEMIAYMMTETEDSAMNEMFYEELAMVENDAFVANVYTDVIEYDEYQMEYVMENMMENISSGADMEQTDEGNLATHFFEAMLENNPEQMMMMAETYTEDFNDMIAATDPTNVAGSFNDMDATMDAMYESLSPKEQRQLDRSINKATRQADRAMAKEQRQFDRAMAKEQRQFDRAMAKLGYDPNDPYMNDPMMMGMNDPMMMGMNDSYMNDPMMMGMNDPYMNDPMMMGMNDPYMNDPYYDPYYDPYANDPEDDDTEEDLAYGYDCYGNYGPDYSCGGFAPIEYNGIMYYTQATYDYALNAAGWTWNGTEYASQMMYDDARTLDGTMYDTEIMYNDRLTELYYGGTQYYTQAARNAAENAAGWTWNGTLYASQMMYDDARTLDGTMYDTEIMYNDRLTELYYGGTQYYTQAARNAAENAAGWTWNGTLYASQMMYDDARTLDGTMYDTEIMYNDRLTELYYGGTQYYTQAARNAAENAAGWTWNGTLYASQMMYDDARTLDGTMYDTEIMYNDRLTELYYGGTQYYTQAARDAAENAAGTTVTWTSIDEDADDIFSLGYLYQDFSLSFPATSDGGQNVSYTFDASFNLPGNITTADLTSGSLTGPEISYLTAEEYNQTYSFLATATAMVGGTTITSDARTFTFFIPELVTYQTSPN